MLAGRLLTLMVAGLAPLSLVLAILWQSQCTYDCGEEGRAWAAMVVVALASATVASHAFLTTFGRLDAGRRVGRGWTIIVSILAWASIVGAAACTLMGGVLALVALEGWLWPDRVNNAPDYGTAWAASAGAVCLALVALAALRISARARRLRRLWTERL